MNLLTLAVLTSSLALTRDSCARKNELICDDEATQTDIVYDEYVGKCDSCLQREQYLRHKQLGLEIQVEINRRKLMMLKYEAKARQNRLLEQLDRQRESEKRLKSGKSLVDMLKWVGLIFDGGWGNMLTRGV